MIDTITRERLDRRRGELRLALQDSAMALRATAERHDMLRGALAEIEEWLRGAEEAT